MSLQVGSEPPLPQCCLGPGLCRATEPWDDGQLWAEQTSPPIPGGDRPALRGKWACWPQDAVTSPLRALPPANNPAPALAPRGGVRLAPEPQVGGESRGAEWQSNGWGCGRIQPHPLVGPGQAVPGPGGVGCDPGSCLK